MNKKMALLFTFLLVLALFLVIIAVGVRESDSHDKTAAQELLVYEYLGTNPQQVNHKMIEYLLEKDPERRKLLLPQDISMLKCLKFNEKQLNLSLKPDKGWTRAGSKRYFFIIHNPYYAHSDGFKWDVQEYKNKTILAKENNIYSDQYLTFKLLNAQFKSLNSQGEKEYYKYIEITKKLKWPATFSNRYQLKISDNYYGKLNYSFFLSNE